MRRSEQPGEQPRAEHGQEAACHHPEDHEDREPAHHRNPDRVRVFDRGVVSDAASRSHRCSEVGERQPPRHGGEGLDEHPRAECRASEAVQEERQGDDGDDHVPPIGRHRRDRVDDHLPAVTGALLGQGEMSGLDGGGWYIACVAHCDRGARGN